MLDHRWNLKMVSLRTKLLTRFVFLTLKLIKQALTLFVLSSLYRLTLVMQKKKEMTTLKNKNNLSRIMKKSKKMMILMMKKTLLTR